MYATDPNILPVVYDFPACEDTTELRLLDCPRRFLQQTSLGNLGRLLFEEDAAVGINALVGIVGVSCESKSVRMFVYFFVKI